MFCMAKLPHDPVTHIGSIIMDDTCIQYLGLSDPPRAADLRVIAEGCLSVTTEDAGTRWMPVPQPIQHYSLIYVVDRQNKKVSIACIMSFRLSFRSFR